MIAGDWEGHAAAAGRAAAGTGVDHHAAAVAGTGVGQHA